MIASDARAPGFNAYLAAARKSYQQGGLRPEAADAIVIAAAENISALITHELSFELIGTLILSMELERERYVRRNGAASFMAWRS
jgi:hypothetical protein